MRPSHGARHWLRASPPQVQDESGGPAEMDDEEIETFEMAWNKYMGEQALLVQPLPDFAEPGNLLNQQESIAFSRFFDNLLAQPSSPRKTARRLDEELQRLSYLDTASSAARHASSHASPHASSHTSSHASSHASSHTEDTQRLHTENQNYMGGSTGFAGSQPFYGKLPSEYDQRHSPYMPQHLSYPGGILPQAAGSYAGMQLPKITSPSVMASTQQLQNVPAYVYAMGSVGVAPQAAPYATDTQFDPRFFPQATYRGSVSPPNVGSSIMNTSGTSQMNGSAGVPSAYPDALQQHASHAIAYAHERTESPPAKRQRTDSESESSSSIIRRPRQPRGEAETRVNHMNSEKRRRAHIRDLFERMCSLVPRVATSQETLPKSVVLQETYARLLELEARNTSIRRQIEKQGIATDSVPAIALEHSAFAADHTNLNEPLA